MTAQSSAGAETVAEEPLQDVWLRAYPLGLGVRASEHYESVFREFALLAGDESADPADVPSRVLALIDAFGRRYRRDGALEDQRDAALARGQASADIVVRMPVSAIPASQSLDAMLDETDDFCRDGTLLTLAPAGDVVAFRRWYIREVIEQLAGRPPRAWSGAPS